jgi:pimeloyl-ACP methyl ester carboxylesterase
MDAIEISPEADGLPVILPGLLCDSRMFVRQLEAFPRVVVLDGFYGGSKSIEAMASWALERLPRRCALIGHSMGGRVALEMVRRAPERATRLLLCSTGVHPPQPGEAEKRHALRDLGRSKGFAALVDSWLPPMLSPAAREEADLVARLRAMCVSAGQKIFEAQIEALLARPPVEALLARLTCPTLVSVGDLDAWSPVAQHRDIAAAIPGAELRIVPGAGHMLPVEAPEAFNACISQWLALPPRHAPD